MKRGEVCAGYDGLGLAVDAVLGSSPIWFSEFDEAPSKILAYHFPGVPNYGDMTKIDWAAIGQADVISGGTPCQDLSPAGRRAGMSEGTRSNLWVQMREAIAIQRPTWVVWENVRGAYSATAHSDLEQCPGCMGDTSDGRVVLRALGRVLGDLSDLGYDCQWRGLRAADVGACHARFRVFVLAADRDRIGHEWPRGAWNGWAGLTDDSKPPAHGGQRGITSRQDAGSTPVRDFVPIAWGDYGAAIQRWETVMGRHAPAPTELSAKGFQRLSPRFTEWMMGLPDGWVTDPAIGISRNEQLKACGNGVVPQQAEAALRDMLSAFRKETK